MLIQVLLFLFVTEFFYCRRENKKAVTRLLAA